MERNYREDQHNEIEALDAIYPELESMHISMNFFLIILFYISLQF